MIRFDATVTATRQHDGLWLVYFDISGYEVVMMSLQMSEPLREGDHVILGLKPTAVALQRGDCIGSRDNRLPATVTGIQEGVLLKAVQLEVAGTSCEAVMIAQTLDRMQLQPAERVDMVFMASDLFVVEVRDA